jgi:hypothetical protein
MRERTEKEINACTSERDILDALIARNAAVE